MSPVDDDLLERKVRDLLASRSGAVGPEPGLLDGSRERARRIRLRRRAGTAALAVAVAVVAGLLAVPGARQSAPPTATRPAGFAYDWPLRGPLAGDAEARAAALDAASAESAASTGGQVLSRRVLWIGPVTNGYAAVLRTVVRTGGRSETLLSGAFSYGRNSTGQWVFRGTTSSVSELKQNEAVSLVVQPSYVNNAYHATSLLVLTAPNGIASVQYATVSTVGADGKVRPQWRAASPSDGVVQVDRVPLDVLLDLALRVRLASGATIETMADQYDVVSLGTRWNGHRVRPGSQEPIEDWSARHGVPSTEGWFTIVWSDRLPDGTPAMLAFAGVGRHLWGLFSGGRPFGEADVRLPDASPIHDYVGPPEISAYLPTTGAYPCALVVVVPHGVTQVLLDGAPMRLERGTAMASTSRCSGGQLTVRAKDGRTTYHGPVDTDR